MQKSLKQSSCCKQCKTRQTQKKTRLFHCMRISIGPQGEDMRNLIYTDTPLLHFLVSLLSEIKDAAESRPMVYGQGYGK